jgi:DNA-binding Lrp family transcriptional regulator
MPEAYILVNTEVGAEDDVLERLKKLGCVNEAHCVYGTYDIVAKVEADSMDALKEITTWKVRKLDEVRDTLTMIITK